MSRQQMGAEPLSVLKEALLNQDGRYKKALIYSLLVGLLSLRCRRYLIKVNPSIAYGTQRSAVMNNIFIIIIYDCECSVHVLIEVRLK